MDNEQIIVENDVQTSAEDNPKENKSNENSEPIAEQLNENNPTQAEPPKEQQAKDDWEDKFLRVTAEYHNHRTRSQKEKEALGSDVLAQTATQFLPVLDNLERALESETTDENYAKGVALIHKQMLEILEKMKIVEISAKGQPFDPKYMEAASHIEDESLGENIVANVFAKGYRMDDRILRYAVVQVAN